MNKGCSPKPHGVLGSLSERLRSIPGDGERSLVLAAALLFALPGAQAAILMVNTAGVDNPDCAVLACQSIQFAINQASAGDTILVAGGVYHEPIILNKSVRVVSNGGATLLGNRSGPVVEAVGTASGAVLEGFSIIGGENGIVLHEGALEIRRNIIADNGTSQGFAPAIALQNASALIVNNLIRRNGNALGNGAIGIEHCAGAVAIINNTIDGNMGPGAGEGGAQAIFVLGSNNVLIQNNIISNHAFSNLPAIYSASEIPPALRNNLFFDNADLYQDASGVVSSITALNSLTFSQGNIVANPMYVNPASNDFHLQAGSGAIDAGVTANAPLVDIDGDARPVGGSVDIGFDESLLDGGGGTPAQCADGIDNDGDMLTDLGDPGCGNSSDNDESNVQPPTTACNSTVTTLAELLAEVGQLTTSQRTKNNLTSILKNVSMALEKTNNEKARTQLANFVQEVVRLSNLAEPKANRIQPTQANNLVCGTANVVTRAPLP